MHVPGHNPFVEELIQDLMLHSYSSAGIIDDIPTYEYSGISPEIMQALGNVFSLQEFSSGQQFQIPGTGFNAPILSEGFGYYGLAPYIDQDNPQFGEEAGTPKLFMESALPFTNIFDAASIAETLSGFLGEGEDIRAAEVKALTPEMIAKTTSEYYSPYEESERQSLVEKLGAAMSKAQTGGFAGSGARQSGLSGAERLYRGGYGDILSDIMKMRAKATGDVLDTIYGYQELLNQPG